MLSIPIVLYFYYNPIPLSGEMAETMAEYGFEPVLPFSAIPPYSLNRQGLCSFWHFLVGLYPI
jgi:putative ABC transport system permease protein